MFSFYKLFATHSTQIYVGEHKVTEVSFNWQSLRHHTLLSAKTWFKTLEWDPLSYFCLSNKVICKYRTLNLQPSWWQVMKNTVFTVYTVFTVDKLQFVYCKKLSYWSSWFQSCLYMCFKIYMYIYSHVIKVVILWSDEVKTSNRLVWIPSYWFTLTW